MIDIGILIVLVALIIATYTDIKKREVPDWLSYSFIAVALITALVQTVVFGRFIFIINSLIGLAVFFAIANILYYGKMFAGGDAKLLIGMGAALGTDFSFLINLLVLGGVYGLVCSFVLAITNIKGLKKQLKKVKINVIPFAIIVVLSIACAFIFNMPIFYFMVAFSIISPMLLVMAIAVEKACLIRFVSPEKLSEGDWLAENIRINKRIFIKAKFEGLSKKEIKLLKKANKKVRVKYGLPFVPVFLLAFIAEIFLGNLLYFIVVSFV